MGFLAFLILGLIAGAIARLIIPGRQRGGWILTLLLGVVGAMLGGWIAGFFVEDAYENFWSIPAWVAAIVGALIVTIIFNLLFNRRRTSA
jgi:uncharacterized membrane protein YeaQ/YmgE (transglycosylase-associated protein family)